VTSPLHRFLTLALLAGVSVAAGAQAQESREFSFFLARFQYLFLARTPDGYRLTLVTDSKTGEICRLQFNDFHATASSPDMLHLKQSFRDTPEAGTDDVQLHLVRLPEEHGISPRWLPQQS
jgi:hypothetical protein